MIRTCADLTLLFDWQEALPADFNIDGEHMVRPSARALSFQVTETCLPLQGCAFVKWQNRHREPYACRSAGMQTLATVLSNVLCN